MSYSVEQHVFLVKHDGDMVHLEKCMVCCFPLPRWANFFSSTVSADLYLHVLQEEFLLCPQGMGFSLGGTFFQQDRVQKNAVLVVLNEDCDNRIV